MLEFFLNKKPLYYDEIDYSRMPRVYSKVKSKLKIPKIIHLIGTNGKGTTGRFLAQALNSLSFNVGHYTSPHILEFNERIWQNGSNVSTGLLNEKHLELLKLLSSDDANSLSYFEYTTLLAIMLFQGCDYVVLEAGLGGEYDATAVFENILTLVTPIDKDHEAFLGDTIEKIATTKLNAIQKYAIIASQPNKEVYDIAKMIEKNNSVSIKQVDSFIDEDDEKKIQKIREDNSLETYLVNNLRLSIAALKFLSLDYSSDDFIKSRLFGRLTQFRPNVIIDVGHNVLAAKSIYESLKESKYTLVYNSYKDKHYEEILRILKPIIIDVELIEIEDSRIESLEVMQKVLKELDLKYSSFIKTKEDKNYLVFGSFSVIEMFLKEYVG
ncbi:Mur ligase family protein [Sulfurimonas sp.]|uniref:Mur ligase family protein n=1 Tax=Sulfurimonas sp. TaxID=2022749 RepID=UPI0025EFADE9|nr:Mur ligase family protein [Sulfurimonas sp.]